MDELASLFQREFEEQHEQDVSAFFVSSLQQRCINKISHLIRKRTAKEATWLALRRILPEPLIKVVYINCYVKIFVMLYSDRHGHAPLDLSESRVWEHFDSNFASISFADKVKDYVLANVNRFVQ